MTESLHPAELAAFSGEAASFGDRLLTRVGAGVDATVLAAMQRVVDRLMMPSADELPRMLASAASMMRPELLAEPGRFFAFDEARFAPDRVRERTLRGVGHGKVVRTRLRLGYRPFAPEDGEAEREVELPVERWLHPRTPRATVIAVHGFTMGQPRIGAVVLMASQWYRAGLDVALVTLPHHGERTPPDARFSGESFAVPDVGRLADAVRQAVFELRALHRWLAADRGAPVGALGLSLGGYITALLASLEPDLAFAVPMAPPVCIGDLAWRFTERSQAGARDGEPALSRDVLRQAFRVHSPLAHPLRLAPERVLIVAGQGDRIVPPAHPQSLWLHWKAPAIHWFAGSHLAPFGRSGIVHRVREHWRSLGLAH